MQYAQIKNGKVINIIVVDDNSPMKALEEGTDHFLRVDELECSLGANYDGKTFTSSKIVPTEKEIQAQIKHLEVRKAELEKKLSEVVASNKKQER